LSVIFFSIGFGINLMCSTRFPLNGLATDNSTKTCYKDAYTARNTQFE